MKQLPQFYAADLKVVVHFLGYLIVPAGISLSVPFFASIFLREWKEGIPYLLMAIFSVGLGWLLLHIKPPRKLRFVEAVVLIGLTYIYTAISSSVPLYMAGLSAVDAFFEAVSGITTTGLSMITEWEAIPNTTFFARAYLQWIGGLGILIFSLALSFHQGDTTKRLREVVSQPDDIVSGSKAYAKKIALAYTLLTGAGIIILYFMGTSIYDAVVLIFASVSTGGFSPYQDGISGFSHGAQIVMMVFAFSCAFSLAYYYHLWSLKKWLNLDMVQIIGLAVLSVVLAILLGPSFDSWILSFSAQTTTGFSSLEVPALSVAKKLLLIVSMGIGGGTGSTAGGVKILRVFLLFAFIRTLLIRLCQTNHAFYQPRFFGQTIEDKRFQHAVTLVALYGMVALFSWYCFLIWEYPPIDALFDVVSALGTVGISTGIISPELPLFLKGVLCVDMLFGRLEIIPWLIILYPRTWLGERLEV